MNGTCFALLLISHCFGGKSRAQKREQSYKKPSLFSTGQNPFRCPKGSGIPLLYEFTLALFCHCERPPEEVLSPLRN